MTRVFLTGGSGFIGSALLPKLRQRGYEVSSLARSEEAARTLQQAGVTAVRGSLDDLDTLREQAAAADGVIHLAFRHDVAFSGNFGAAVASDRQAIEALAAGLVR